MFPSLFLMVGHLNMNSSFHIAGKTSPHASWRPSSSQIHPLQGSWKGIPVNSDNHWIINVCVLIWPLKKIYLDLWYASVSSLMISIIGQTWEKSILFYSIISENWRWILFLNSMKHTTVVLFRAILSNSGSSQPLGHLFSLVAKTFQIPLNSR